MARPSHKEIHDWALNFAESDPGLCDLVWRALKENSWRGMTAPDDQKRIGVLIDRGYAQNHYALEAIWQEGALVIDGAIGQFGGDAAVFVGTVDEWIGELQILTGAKSVELDDLRSGKYKTKLFAEAERSHQKKLALPELAPRVSKDHNMARTASRRRCAIL